MTCNLWDLSTSQGVVQSHHGQAVSSERTSVYPSHESRQVISLLNLAKMSEVLIAGSF